MWLVNSALRHPYLVWVGMILAAVLGWIGYARTPTDILPTLKVPVVVVFASYRGMPATDMEQTVTAILERALTKCDHLERIESRSMLGMSIIQVYFRPTVSGDIASSQVISIVNGEMQNLPPGMLPPTILNYDASAIPVGNLVISSSSRDDKYLLDIADTRLREDLAGIEGLSAAPVFGGVFRQVQIYVHPRTLEALNMSPLDVARIVNTQSLVIPTGEIRIDKQNYFVRSNAMVRDPSTFGDIPLYNDGRKVVLLKDVAEVIDASRWRTNIVRVDGRRAVYMPLLRQAGASAVTVVDNVKESLTQLKRRGTIPDDVDVQLAFDQSIYVRDALANLKHEAILGGVLASLVVMLFLGSLRATWIVALSIPLSLLAAFAGLYFAGETLNVMTLGGLALVLGRVIDDSVVDVENTVRHLAMGKSPFQAALDSAAEISVPVLMATVTTVIVFLPLVLATGMGKYLFTPLAVSVALAMFASYFVSRTVSPLLCAKLLARPGADGHPTGEKYPRWLLAAAVPLAALGVVLWYATAFHHEEVEELAGAYGKWGAFLLETGILLGIAGVVLLAAAALFRFADTFDRSFEWFTKQYEKVLAWALSRRVLVLGLLGLICVPAYVAFRSVGQELFPDVDSSEFTLHVRATGGPRVEETERQVEEMENLIRGQRANAFQFVRAVSRAAFFGEAERMADIRKANPGKEALIEKISSSPSDRAFLDQVTAELGKEMFDLPGVIPPEDLKLMLANIGISSRWSAIYTPNNGPHAAFLRVQLRSGFAGRTRPTTYYVDRLRTMLKNRFPTHDIYFETGGMIRRILNSGAVAPIEVQVFGRSHVERRRVAEALHGRITRLASVHDAQSPQGIDLPQLTINVDRIKAANPGLTVNDVIRNVITALMSSAQIAPNFWIDPTTGNPYVIGVQYPEYAVSGIRTLEEIPITAGRVGRDAYLRGNASPRGSKATQTVRLEDVATIERGSGPVEVAHYAASRVSQLLVSVADADLAGVSHDIESIVKHFPLSFTMDRLPQAKQRLRDDPEFRQLMYQYLQTRDKKLADRIEQGYGVKAEVVAIPRDIRLKVRGELESMRQSFREMGFSLFLAVLLVYLVMVSQFASWIDPLIMIVAAPLGMVGVSLMLWVTGTTLNIQSCMGILMMVGVSVSNSVLMVEFANRQRASGMTTMEAILSASSVRLRPVLMTTIATLAGLAPMAIHIHPGDEMNLPLARAVIGGLAGSTVLTLFIVPTLYTLAKGPGTITPAEEP
jgi:multidrug efflux pump subunit AcrB